ncbi:putative cytochrome P450 28a5 [Pseudolycoriella hygida]|uniref:Cytochrome P450 28a5 n=1 Tax=Pseudolycoriella hygida TaxID=35572 RepID=A0A9Q0RZQ0_9DIPT|nr:putative cytochrome P450 28a5 [Pseudolycoriella hygida]
MVTFLFGIFFFGLSLYLYLTWNFDYWKRRGVVGPRPRPYVGTFPKTALMDKNSNYISETSEIFRKYYRKHRFIGIFEYREPKLMILDPALTVDIYVKYFKHFADNTMSETVFAKQDPLFKPNPFIATGSEWKERRTDLAPAFTMLRVKGMYPVIEDSCQRLVSYINDLIESGQSIIASKNIACRVTANSLCSNMYGLDAKAFDDHSDFVENSLRMFEQVPTFRTILWTIFPVLNKLFPNRSVSKEFNEWFIGLYKMAVELRSKNNIQRDDYLNLLMDLQKKKNMSVTSSAANAFVFFLDGFETTSYILGSAINELAKNKNCQEKLRAEVKSSKSRGFDDLNQLPYLDAVVNGNLMGRGRKVKKTTRVSPFPFPIWKTCTENIELTDLDGRVVLIEKGTKIILPTTAMHQHPDYYHDPDKFNPERFTTGAGDPKTLKDAGVFNPFGNGPRICMGMRWAICNIKAVLCTLVDNFEFSVRVTEEKPSTITGMLFFSNNTTQLEFKRLQ